MITKQINKDFPFCPKCGFDSKGYDICPKCGKVFTKTDAKVFAPTQKEKINTGKQNLYTEQQYCPKCGNVLYPSPSKIGTVLIIIAFGIFYIISLILPVIIASIFGFIFLAFGIWKQAYPTFYLTCKACKHKITSTNKYNRRIDAE